MSTAVLPSSQGHNNPVQPLAVPAPINRSTASQPTCSGPRGPFETPLNGIAKPPSGSAGMESKAAAHRAGHVAGQEGPRAKDEPSAVPFSGSVLANLSGQSGRPKQSQSDSLREESLWSKHVTPSVQTRGQVGEKGNRERATADEDGEEWAEKRVMGGTDTSDRSPWNLKYQRSSSLVGEGGIDPSVENSDWSVDLERVPGDEALSECSSDTCRADTGRGSARGKAPGRGFASGHGAGSAPGKLPGGRERYEKEMAALQELVREYEVSALQKKGFKETEISGRLFDRKTETFGGLFDGDGDTDFSALGTPDSELSLGLKTPPEPRTVVKRMLAKESLGGLLRKQTARESTKGSKNLKKSLAETRQAAKEAIKSVRAVYCASGCATQQMREREKVWKQQLVSLFGVQNVNKLLPAAEAGEDMLHTKYQGLDQKPLTLSSLQTVIVPFLALCPGDVFRGGLFIRSGKRIRPGGKGLKGKKRQTWNVFGGQVKRPLVCTRTFST